MNFRIVYVLVTLALLLGCRSNPTLPKHNVIIIAVDTLGASHVQVLEKEGKLKGIGQILKNGVVFERAYSVAPWTQPSFASLFTSQYPFQHRVQKIGKRFRPEVLTLAERMGQLGMETAGIVSHTLLTPTYGFDKGFSSYEHIAFDRSPSQIVSSEDVTTRGIKWLDSKLEKAKVGETFLFLHYFDPHYSYMHHPNYDRTSWYDGELKAGMAFSTLRRMSPKLSEKDIGFNRELYREEILYTDENIAKLLDYLKEKGLDKNTLIVFLADHGEEFHEHGAVGHTKTVFEELIHIPMVFYFPGQLKPKRVDGLVSNLDVMPTLLEFKGEDLGKIPHEGESLVPILSGSKSGSDTGRVVLSETEYLASKIAAVSKDFKLIQDKDRKRWRAYKISDDPGESKQLDLNSDPVFGKLKQLIMAYNKRAESAPKKVGEPDKELNPEEVEQLKSLGYL